MSTELLDLALLLMRLATTYYLLGHGLRKLGLLGGAGLAGTGAFFESVGYRPGRLFAGGAAAAEIAAGVLLAAGLLTQLAGAVAVAVLGAAALAVPTRDDPRVELARALAIVPLGLVLAGAGRLSVDALLGLAPNPTAAVVLAVLAVASAPIGHRLLRRGPGVRPGI